MAKTSKKENKKESKKKKKIHNTENTKQCVTLDLSIFGVPVGGISILGMAD